MEEGICAKPAGVASGRAMPGGKAGRPSREWPGYRPDNGGLRPQAWLMKTPVKAFLTTGPSQGWVTNKTLGREGLGRALNRDAGRRGWHQARCIWAEGSALVTTTALTSPRL